MGKCHSVSWSEITNELGTAFKVLSLVLHDFTNNRNFYVVSGVRFNMLFTIKLN
jgi:hypothetical protein